jgi:hypothetical protein
MTARCSLSAGISRRSVSRKAPPRLTAGCWSRLRGVAGRADSSLLSWHPIQLSTPSTACGNHLAMRVQFRAAVPDSYLGGV